MIRPLRRLGLLFAFGLTGVGTALLGAALPATLHSWRLSDERGGLLLLAAWGGSTSGALMLLRRVSGNSVALGLMLAALGLLALSLPHPAFPIVFYLLYGVGLGMTMTAISMLRSREVSASQADVELNRLNLVWAVGALAAPAIAFQSLRLLSVGSLFRVMGFVFGAMGVLLYAVQFFSEVDEGPLVHGAVPGGETRAWAPVRFCVFAAAAVGLESAVGSWLTTYTQRMTLGAAAAASANSAFWAGLLVSRAAHSVHSAGWLHTRNARIGHLLLVGVAIVLLVGVPRGLVLPVAGLLGGLGLGPLYPYVLSVALPRFRSNAVFVLAGVGASLVPWLTGVLSSAAGSLRVGLLAPCLGFLVLVGAAVSMRAELADGAS